MDIKAESALDDHLSPGLAKRRRRGAQSYRDCTNPLRNFAEPISGDNRYVNFEFSAALFHIFSVLSGERFGSLAGLSEGKHVESIWALCELIVATVFSPAFGPTLRFILF